MGTVNKLAISKNLLAYIKGRSLVIHDLLDKTLQPQQIITRDSLLKTMAVNEAGTLIALGDDFGKIYIVHHGKKAK